MRFPSSFPRRPYSKIDTAQNSLFTAPSPDDPSRSASLLVDAASLPLVKGSTIDYATELIGSAFRIRDNPQSKDAGCGCGVSESRMARTFS